MSIVEWKSTQSGYLLENRHRLIQWVMERHNVCACFIPDNYVASNTNSTTCSELLTATWKEERTEAKLPENTQSNFAQCVCVFLKLVPKMCRRWVCTFALDSLLFSMSVFRVLGEREMLCDLIKFSCSRWLVQKERSPTLPQRVFDYDGTHEICTQQTK